MTQSIIETEKTEKTQSNVPARILSMKIQPRHLEKLAVVYRRQSTRPPVNHNTESTSLQHGLAQRVAQLGWPWEQILVIDENQGRNAAHAQDRPGWARWRAEVRRGRVGLIMVLPRRRLARPDQDWFAGLQRGARGRLDRRAGWPVRSGPSQRSTRVAKGDNANDTKPN